MAKKTKLDCDFCTIASGGSAVSVVDQTDSVLVLMDIQPVNPGHAWLTAMRRDRKSFTSICTSSPGSRVTPSGCGSGPSTGITPRGPSSTGTPR